MILNSEEAGAVFYERLFEIDPSLKPLFAHAMPAQINKLMDMLTVMVANLQTMDSIEKEVKALAIRHVHYGTRPEHYDSVGKALMYTLEIQLADGWDEDTRHAWSEVYAVWANAMLGAAYN